MFALRHENPPGQLVVDYYYRLLLSVIDKLAITHWSMFIDHQNSFFYSSQHLCRIN